MMETADICVAFYGAIVHDARIGIAHISVFMALYHLWRKNGATQPFYTKRAEVMELSKISSSATYHKVIRQLSDYGYIGYFPCCHPGRKSEVYFSAMQGETIEVIHTLDI